MRKYTEQHKHKILSKTNTILDRLLPGHVITFEYPDSEKNKRPIVLVLNPNEKNLLHGLVFDYMTPKQVTDFGKYLLREIKEIEPDELNTNVQTSLYKLSIDNPISFYNFRLKPYLEKRFKQSIYRTYNIKNISNIKVIKYNFT